MWRTAVQIQLVSQVRISASSVLLKNPFCFPPASDFSTLDGSHELGEDCAVTKLGEQGTQDA
jgi:hypothetical protein